MEDRGGWRIEGDGGERQVEDREGDVGKGRGGGEMETGDKG